MDAAAALQVAEDITRQMKKSNPYEQRQEKLKKKNVDE